MNTAEPGNYNVCAIAKTSEIIGDLWNILIVRELLVGEKRFSHLQASLIRSDNEHSISSKTLSQRLKFLEEKGIVDRRVQADTTPVQITYTLSAKGQDLSDIITQMREFGEKHLV